MLKLHIIKENNIMIDDIESEEPYSDYERLEITAEHVTALLNKKMVFVRVQQEYMIGIVLVHDKGE